MAREEDPTTQEHRVRQAKRELDARRDAESAETEPDVAKAERRADKAAYLRQKLEERARSERRR
jgi:hypothetical protein